MIDFRYHLVSIISIFLALAVGIVLGAGPLKGSIGTTLTQELENTRKDKADLNTQLIAAKKLQASSNAFAGSVLGNVVDGKLAGQKVALVVGPNPSDAATKGINDAVTQAGGQVVTTVTLTPAFFSGDDAAARAGAVGTIAAAIGESQATASPQARSADLTGVVLGRGFLQGAKGAPAYVPATGTSIMRQLRDAGLARISAQPGVDGVPVPTLVVLLAGSVATDPAAEQSAQTDNYLGLARGLDTVAAGTVLASDYSSSTNPGSSASVVSAARSSNDTSQVVTTVDDVDLAMGEAGLVLGLVRERTGVAGRYGVRDDAQGVLPSLPTPSPSATPSS